MDSESNSLLEALLTAPGPSGYERPIQEVEEVVQLLRSLDPKPGAQIGALTHDTYVVPDCVVWRQRGVWRAALAGNNLPRITIHSGTVAKVPRRCASPGVLVTRSRASCPATLTRRARRGT